MNHKTEAEQFLARLNAMSTPQLHEAMRYLHIVDPGVVERALAFAATPFAAPDAGGLPEPDPAITRAMLDNLRSALTAAALPDCDDAAEFSHIAIEGTS